MKYQSKKIKFKNKNIFDYRRSNVILMETIQPSQSVQHSNNLENHVENHIETSQNEEYSSSLS
jgi:hypothetical protein